MAKCRDFDRVVRAFKSRYGIDLSHMRMKWSKHPVYKDGRRSFEFPDNEHGGSWCSDGAIRINPNMRTVMERFGIDGKVSEFRRRIIAHELAHEIWHNQANQDRIKRLIRDSLRQARKEKFTTPYLDTYSPDTPKKKFDSELFAEWMSDQLNKQAQVVDPDKWPDDFMAWQREHDDDIVWKARKAVIENLKNGGKWGLMRTNGRYLTTNDEVDNDESMKDVVIRSGRNARRSKITNCHELAGELLARLRKNRINARRVFVDKDMYNGIAMGHSTVFFQDKDGRWHRATNGMGRRKKSPFGDFDSLEDAIDQYIAVEKANKQTTDDERVEAFDTTDLPFTDRMSWPEYKALARTGKRLYRQEKKAQAYEPPWTIDRIREEYGDEVADRLANDPVHKWRSDTGIELIHREPTKEELLRIIENWRLMDALKKRRSNRKSKELFGMTNLQHAKELLGQ